MTIYSLDVLLFLFGTSLCSMSSSNCCFLTCIQVSQEASQVVWYSHLFQNFPQFIMIHTVKGFGVVNKAEVDVFLELSCFFDDPTGVGNLISGSSAFLKPAWTSGSSQFMYCWSLAWRILWDECSCAVVSVLWHCLSLGLEWKLQVDDRLLFYKCWNKMKYLQCVEGW